MSGTIPGSATETQARRHFSSFDGLRAIAALSILLLHLGFQTAATYTTRFGPYLARLDAGVPVFFLISGFLLYRPYAAAHLLDRPAVSTGPYFVRRAARIFPAYWVALTGIIVFFGLRLHGLRDWVTFYGLLQIYDTHRYLHGISQAWSLATEISFYIALPAYAWILGRLTAGRPSTRRLRRELCMLAAVGAAGLAFRAYADFGHGTVNVIGVYWLPAWADLFAIGMALAVISVAYEGGIVRSTAVEFVGRHPALSWTTAAAVYWVVATRLNLPPGLEPISPKRELARHVGYGLIALFLLLPAVFGEEHRGRIRGLLSSRLAVELGLVSYGVYVWHQAWLEQARRWTGAPSNNLGGNFWAVGAIGLTGTLLVAAASWHLVEQPILRAAHRRSRTRRPDLITAGRPA
jgi:peptidoglycan/LPS O-acetylase OafA/YrhL